MYMCQNDSRAINNAIINYTLKKRKRERERKEEFDLIRGLIIRRKNLIKNDFNS